MLKAVRASVALLVLLWCLSCASTPDPVLCGQIGVGLGMGGGATAGAKSQHGSDAGPVIGWGLAGAVVGGVGGYLLCKALKHEEEPAPAPRRAEPEPRPAPTPAPQPAPDPCAQVLRLRGVHFAFDKAVIRPEDAVILDEAAGLLKESLSQCPSKRVSVDGYTDSTGPEAYNEKLSERRAGAVRSYLVGKGVDGAQLQTRGFGETDPIADNSTREGRALNRRVEIRMVP